MRSESWVEFLKGRDHSEDEGLDGRIMLQWISWKGIEGVDWTHVDRCPAVVNTVADCQGP